MTLGASILSALFVMLVVFSVLVILWALIRIFSVLVVALERRAKSADGSGDNAS
jgi:Na+-transporting methylmalonyl-CoA/oxaloacetate decarboxylase gamma subunit